MPIVFPPSPTDGQTYTFNGRTWRWSAAASSWLNNGLDTADLFRRLSVRAVIMGT